MEQRGGGDTQVQDSTGNNKRLWATPSFFNTTSFVDYNYQLMTVPQLVAVTQHSTVHKSYSRVFGRFVAIKIIDKKSIPSFLVEKFLPRELEITKRVNHPHIVHCLHIAQPQPTKVVIIYEFCDGGTLLKYVLDYNGLEEKEAGRLFRQLIDAVYHLHFELSVAHRDIKLENILLDSNKVLKLADFGFARQTYKAEKSTSYCGTRPYSSPQLVNHTPYEPFAADWFACGIALYTMIAGFWPHKPWEMITYPVKSTERISHSAKNLIDRLIENDEEKRADFKECINSEWLLKHTADGSWIVPQSTSTIYPNYKAY
uniref:Protein kinase domain-containing protein n=1 Tax=Panagrolaimus sp. ES5 TaxID=591445 RepID=A0AC34F8W3_9BILA